MVAVSYLFRIVVPYGTSLLEFPSLAYLTQYLSYFLIEILAYKRDWLRSVPGSLGQVGFVLAILASVSLFLVVRIGSDSAWIGHGSWQLADFALWDSILAVGMSLGLITFFSPFTQQREEARPFLSENSFAVYVIHVPVIIFAALVPKDYGFGITFNFAHPASWVILTSIIARIIVGKVFHKSIF
jgi:hypothetical protein